MKLNVLFHSINKGLDLVVPLALIPIVNFYFGKEVFGLYSITTSLYLVGVLALDWDCSMNGAADIAGNKSIKKRQVVIVRRVSLKVLLTAIPLICLLFFYRYSDLPSEWTLFSIVYLASLLLTPFNFTWIFIGLSDFVSILIANLITKTIYIVCVFLAVFLIEDVSLIAIGLSFLFANLCLALYHYYRLTRVYSIQIIKPKYRTLKNGVDVFLTNVMQIVYGHGTILFVGANFGLISAGVFNINYKVPAIIVALYQPVIQVFFPKIASLRAASSSALTKTVYKMFTFIALTAFALCIGYLFIAELLISKVFFSTYNPVFTFLLTLSVFFTVMNSLLIYLLIALKLQRIVRNSLFYLVVINIVFCFVGWLTEKSEYVAMGMSFSQMFLFVLFSVYIRRTFLSYRGV